MRIWNVMRSEMVILLNYGKVVRVGVGKNRCAIFLRKLVLLWVEKFLSIKILCSIQSVSCKLIVPSGYNKLLLQCHRF